MHRTLIGILLLAALLGGCTSLTESETVSTIYSDNQVVLNLTDEELTIFNVGEETFFYSIFPSEYLPYVDWVPCSHPDTCPEKLTPDEITVIPLRGIIERETESITFFWYHLVKNLDGVYVAENLTQPVLDSP